METKKGIIKIIKISLILFVITISSFNGANLIGNSIRSNNPSIVLITYC